MSAKYGLLDPESVVSPYEMTLNTMRVAERRDWAERVITDLRALLTEHDLVVFLAGERYREFLLSPLRKMGMEVEIPMSGLQIGRQLQWFDQRDA